MSSASEVRQHIVYRRRGLSRWWPLGLGLVLLFNAAFGAAAPSLANILRWIGPAVLVPAGLFTAVERVEITDEGVSRGVGHLRTQTWRSLEAVKVRGRDLGFIARGGRPTTPLGRGWVWDDDGTIP